VLQSNEFETFENALDAFFSNHPPPDGVSDAAIAAAGPLQGEEIKLTNSSWLIRCDALRERFETRRIGLLNDFAAVGHAVPHLTNADMEPIGGKAPIRDGTESLLVIGPGTGLGMCLIVPDGRDGWCINPTEGGHARLALVNREERMLFQRSRYLDQAIQAEDILSGPGLARLHNALGGPLLEPEAISDAARRGEAPALRTVDAWLNHLARFAADAVLITGAFGGVLFVGAIVPGLRRFVQEEAFRATFEGTSRVAGALRETPTAIVHRADLGLLGLTHIEIPMS